MINKLFVFCQHRNVEFPLVSVATIADFLCELADSSEKPASMIRSASAAITCLCDAQQVPNMMRSADIGALKAALIKSGTTAPRTRSLVMPIKPFHDLFLQWQDNDILSDRDLHLKCIVLLAITLMLCPSDIAPKSMMFDPQTLALSPAVFSTDQISFRQDGSATISLFGIKNDTSRAGFEERLPSHSNPKLDPVGTLKW